MKKLLALVLALVMVLSLAACAPSNNTTDTGSGNDTNNDNAQQLVTIEKGKLIMATNAEFPPYEMTDDNGNYIGIDVEIAQGIAEKLGLELEILDMAFDAALLAVNEGKSDIVMSGVSVTDARKLVMEFTDSYTTAVQKVIVKADATFTTDDLADKMIGAQRGTTGYIYASDDYGDDHVNAYETGAMAVQALMNGQIDCVIIDSAPAAEYVKANPGLKLMDGDWVTEEYAIGCDKGNTQLVEAINKALAEMVADGTIDAINSKYITAE